MNKKHFLYITLILISISFFALANKAKASATLQKVRANNLGLVGYWSMNGADVTDKVYDRSGQNNNGGFYGGATSTAKTIGKIGQALKFDGVDDLVLINSNPVGTGAFTASAWVYLRSGTTKTLFSLETAGGVTVMECTVIFNGTLACDNESPNNAYAATTDALPLNQWVFVTVARQSSGTAMTLYFNGVRNGAADQTVDPSPSSSGTEFFIGALDDGPSQVWNGSIDEVRVYNRVLSATEIKQLYNMGQAKVGSSQNSRLTSGLVGLWSMDGADYNKASTTAEVLDRSGQNNNGDNSGGAITIGGKLGQALSFDGVDDYINVPDPASGALDFGTATNITASAWVNIPSTNPGVAFLSKNEFNNSPPGYWFGHSNYGQLDYTVGFQFDTATGYCFVAGNSNIADNAWHHVTAVVFRRASCTTSDILIYVDGARQNGYVVLATDNTNANISSGEPLRIAADYSGGSLSYSNVKLDDVRIYSRALSASEVKQLYNLGQDKINSSQNSRLTNGLVGLWSFNGADTNWTSATTGTAIDRSGSNNNGTLTNMSQSASPAGGKIGQALRFDGSNDHIDLNTNLAGTDTVTVCSWIYPSTSVGLYGGIYGNARFVFAVYNQGQSLRLTSNNLGNYAEGASAVSLNVWHHVCGVRLSGGNATIYLDGAQDGTANQNSGTPTLSGATDDAIGAYDAAESDPFAGKIDDTRVYSRALSVTEIQQLYNMGR